MTNGDHIHASAKTMPMREPHTEFIRMNGWPVKSRTACDKSPKVGS